MKKKTPFVTAPALQEEWDEQFDDRTRLVQVDNALCHEIGQRLPAYALYTPQGLAFYRNDHTPYLKDEDGKPKFFELESYQRKQVELRLEQMLRTEVSRDGYTGILVPLKESPNFQTVEDANAYLHNLMFWESLLPPETCGPLMQHIGWLVQKLYTLRERKPKSVFSSLPITQTSRIAGIPAAVADPLAGIPVAAVRAKRVGRCHSGHLSTLVAKRQARLIGMVERAKASGRGNEELYRKVARMLEKQTHLLQKTLGTEVRMKGITLGKGITAAIVLPSEKSKKNF